MTDSEKLKEIKDKLQNGRTGGERGTASTRVTEGGSFSGINSPSDGDGSQTGINTRTRSGHNAAGSGGTTRRIIGGQTSENANSGTTQHGGRTTGNNVGSPGSSVGNSKSPASVGVNSSGSYGDGRGGDGTYSRGQTEEVPLVAVNSNVKPPQADFTGEDSKPFIVDVPPVQEKRKPGRPPGTGTKQQSGKTPAKSTSPSVASFEFILESGFALAAMGFGEHWARPYDEYGSSLKAVAEPLKRSFDRLAPSEIVDLDKYLDIVAVIVGMSMLVKPSLDIEKNRKKQRGNQNTVNAPQSDSFRGSPFGGLNGL